jgi:hypothetical protein
MKWFVSFTMAFALSFTLSHGSEAAVDSRLADKWDESTLVDGQIGRVTMVKDAVLFKGENGQMKKTSLLRKLGSKYRVYSFVKQGKSLYLGVGGDYYLQDTTATTYQTPSSVKKHQLNLLIDNSLINTNLRTTLKQGKLPRQNFILRKSVIGDVVKTYGPPQGIKGAEGSKYLAYNKFEYHIDINNVPINEYKDDQVVIAMSYVFEKDFKLSPSQLKQRFGTQNFTGVGEDYGYTLYYHLENNIDVWFKFTDSERNLCKMTIVKKQN